MTHLFLMNLGKIGDQTVEFFEGHLFLFWQNKIGPAVKKLWSLKDRKGKYFLLHKMFEVLSCHSASEGSVNHFLGKWQPLLR